MQIELGGHFKRAAAKFDNRIAVQSAQRSLTYRQLREAANRIGSAIMRRGIGRGDRVAVLSHNRVELVELWVGLEQWGLARVAMHTHFEMAIHARTLNDVGATVLFFDTSFAAALEAQGLASMAVWVLALNPFRRFYEALGGEPISEQTIERGGQSFLEVAYGWSDVSSFMESAWREPL